MSLKEAWSPNSAKYARDLYASNRRDMHERIRDYSYVSSIKAHLPACHAVADALYDVEGWRAYTKFLYTDVAQWVDTKGSESEKSTFHNTGEVSQRALLAVLTGRAHVRGETVGKVEGRNEKEFFDQVARGPFIDLAFSNAAPGSVEASHGPLSHWITMDRVASVLRRFYPDGSRAFYKAVAESYYWNFIFDARAPFLSSPQGIMTVLGEVLPLLRESNEQKIEKYYHDIDAGDLDAVMALFAPEAAYSRDLDFRMGSKAEIESFYRDRRDLTGKHTILNIKAFENSVFVSGFFEGKSKKKGTPVRTHFNDSWVFDPQTGLVTFRKSWIEVPGI